MSESIPNIDFSREKPMSKEERDYWYAIDWKLNREHELPDLAALALVPLAILLALIYVGIF